MKSVQAFVAGMLVGVLLTYGGGIALRHLARYGVTEQGHMLAPAGILSALKDMHRELDDLTHPPKPPSSFFALRRPIVRSLRMTKSDVVLTLPVQVSMNATVTASPVIAGNTEQSQHNQTVQTAPEAFEVAKSVSASQAAIIPQAVGPKSFRAAAVPPKAAKQASPVRTPEQQYASALKSYEARRYEQAREQFAVFMDTFGDHKLLPNALYWTGEISNKQLREDIKMLHKQQHQGIHYTIHSIGHRSQRILISPYSTSFLDSECMLNKTVYGPQKCP